MHLQFLTGDGRGGVGTAAAMVNGAERLDSPCPFGDHAIGLGSFRSQEQILEEARGEARHIAGDDEIPFRSSDAEGRINASQRAAIIDGVRNHRESKRPVPVRRADQRHSSRGILQMPGQDLDERRAIQGKKRLVPAHAGTAAANQNEAGPRHIGAHEMMIAYANDRQSDAVQRQRTVVELNKRVYICSVLAFAMLAASPMRAASPLSTPVPEPAERTTIVVRADPATGRLVRKKISTRPAPKRTDIAKLVDQASRAHDVDPLLVHSMIRVESNYNPNAVSPKGAEGLMQLTPATARMLGVNDSFDPGQNIEGGVKYLKYLQSVYKDDRLALAAYNAGPGAVEQYKSVPPYPETQNYVNQVGREYTVVRQAAAAAAPPESVVPPEPLQSPEEKHPKLEQFVDQDGRLHLRTVQ